MTTANSTTLAGVTLEMFTPSQENMTRYFRYHGSLTTPGCAEAVVWSLFENPIPLSRDQVFMMSCEWTISQDNVSFKNLHMYIKVQKNPVLTCATV